MIVVHKRVAEIGNKEIAWQSGLFRIMMTVIYTSKILQGTFSFLPRTSMRGGVGGGIVGRVARLGRVGNCD